SPFSRTHRERLSTVTDTFAIGLVPSLCAGVSSLTFCIAPHERMVTQVTQLLHLCSQAEWADAQRCGERRPDSLASDGFVHLSEPQQVHLPANRLFAGRTDLLALHVDPARL